MELFDPLNSGSPTIDDHCRHLAASESRYESEVGKMTLALLDRIRRDIVGPRLGVIQMLKELWFQYSDGHGHRTLITVTIDHKDYSPLVDGIPQMHYRLTHPRSGTDQQDNLPKVELRTRDVEAAYEFVVEAIRACKNPA
jgi:hypothetical protein